MPKLHQKIPVLDGRATVLSYERDPNVWYYREVAKPGEYRSRKIEGATTADEAKLKALDIYTELRNVDQLGVIPLKVTTTKKVKKASIELSINEHLAEQQKRADAGLVGDRYVYNKRYHLKHMADYLETKHIKYVIDIKDDTFDDYLIFRKDTTKVNQNNEVKSIGQWLTWCKKKRQLKPDVAALKLTPTVSIKGEDLQANPPISPEDWRIIEKYIREEYVGKASHRDRRGEYWRKCFYAFVMTGKHSGMRPIEMLNLRWSDIRIMDMGEKAPDSKTDRRRHYVAEISIKKSKTREPRQVPANCGKQLKEWLEYQQWFANEYYSDGIKRVFNKDTHVFCNFNKNCLPYTESQIQKTLRQIYRRLDLSGHWASDKPYTLYSLRSSFVDDKLMADVPVAIVAMMSGHDVKTLMKHYSRLNVMRKSREVTKLPVGIPHDTKQEVELW